MSNVREISPEEFLSDTAPPVKQATVRKKIDMGNLLQEPGAFSRVAIQVLIGLFLLGFGIWNAGSYYNPASRMSVSILLGQIFYTWQLGTVLEIIGSILIYDMIRRI